MNAPARANEFIGTDDLAHITKSSRRAVYQWIAAGTAPPQYRIGKRVLFRLDEVTAWLESHREVDG